MDCDSRLIDYAEGYQQDLYSRHSQLVIKEFDIGLTPEEVTELKDIRDALDRYECNKMGIEYDEKHPSSADYSYRLIK